MMKEFGSNFELSYTQGTGDGCELHNDMSQLFLRSARECLYVIGEKASLNNIKTVYMPALCCSSMVQPFRQLNFHIEYYRLRKDLTIDIGYLCSILKDNALLIVMKYHGMETYDSGEIRELIRKFHNILLIQDCTQHVFTESMYDTYMDYYIGSIRKWIAIPDGAFLLSDKHRLSYENIQIDDNNIFVKTSYASMQEKTEYLGCSNQQIKKSYREKNAFCMQYLKENINPFQISSKSKHIVKHDIVFSDVIKRRRNNYRVLQERIRISHPEVLRFTVAQDCPLCFPIYINERDRIQKKLALNGVYCQVLWPLPVEASSACVNSADYTEHMLAVPCDQRYSTEDMGIVADILSQCLNKG